MTLPGRGWSPSARVMVVAAVLAPAVPIVVALLARRHPPWVPDLDLALTELRVRDVGGPHSPLVGLPGRIGSLDRQGSHPGPISFYLLAPVYRLLGSTAFALQASTVVLHLAGAAVAVGLVARRVGARWALAVGLALGILVAGLGPNLFTEPWNPHLPVLWWPAFLAATWCVLCGDAAALPVLVLAGAVCGQTHVSYLGAVGLLTLGAVAVCLRWPDREAAGSVGRWAIGAVVLTAVVWVPPMIDQARHEPGNATLLAEHLLDPPEPAVGWSDGGRLVLERLDVVHVARSIVVDPGRLADRYPTGASAWRGAFLVGALALIGARGYRWGSRDQRALVGLSVVVLMLAWVSVARIVGYPWGYLLLWVWAVALLVVLAIVATAAAVRRRSTTEHIVAVSPAMVVAMGVVAVAVAARTTVVAGRAEAANPVVSRTVRSLVPAVVARLEPGDRYLVTWTDAVHLGGHGYGMVDELERRGIDVAVRADLGTQFGRHRTAEGGQPDGQLVVATGDAIARWTRLPGAEEVARVDVRAPAEQAEARRTRIALIDELRAEGLADLVPVVDENLFGVAFDPRLTPAARALVDRLDVLGAPAAVFLVPVGSELP